MPRYEPHLFPCLPPRNANSDVPTLKLKFSVRNFQVALRVETFSHSTTKWPSLCPRKSLWNRQEKSSSLQGDPRHRLMTRTERKKKKKTWLKRKQSGEFQGRSRRRGCPQAQEKAGSQSFFSRIWQEFADCQAWKWPTLHSLCSVAQSCPTLCDPMDCSLPSSSIHGDSPGKNTGVGCHAPLQGSSQPRDWTQVSCIVGDLSHQGTEAQGGLCSDSGTEEQRCPLRKCIPCLVQFNPQKSKREVCTLPSFTSKIELGPAPPFFVTHTSWDWSSHYYVVGKIK